MNGTARMLALRAAAQNDRVAGFQAQRTCVCRNVRPALVDDADNAERHAHALDAQAVGARPVGEHGADRIGKGARRFRGRAPSSRCASSVSLSRSSSAPRMPCARSLLRSRSLAITSSERRLRIAAAASRSACFFCRAGACASTCAAATAARPMACISSATDCSGTESSALITSVVIRLEPIVRTSARAAPPVRPDSPPWPAPGRRDESFRRGRDNPGSIRSPSSCGP